ncbi:MAG: single-stranded-DNA-specific exonuclease RecJ [Candidatus Woesebacteria bacterium]|jgi:single-stranded-DNA-specific exonuclease
MENDIKWEIAESLSNSKKKSKAEDIVETILANRGIKTNKQRQEFFRPKNPRDITLKSLGIDSKHVNKAIKRIREAKKENQEVVIYGDYDADGVCATAILWEALYSLGLDVFPYIPERFSEGYGINSESIKKIKKKNPELKLIITVDNGIVANEAVKTANKLGIDIIVTDHHQRSKKPPKAYSIIHTTKIGGAGIAWIFARETLEKIKGAVTKYNMDDSLDLAAIGTVADQLPLLGANRSFVKHGLKRLNDTDRVGLIELFKRAGLFEDSELKELGTYEIGFIIAPRINAAGRLKHALESLRLLCTKSTKRAKKLAEHIDNTNSERQKIVEDIVKNSKALAEKHEWKGMIVVAHKDFHEGVIGLAASRLVEEFYRPAIVLSKGKVESKASARSITGFNVIETIREFEHMLIDAGGHPMAAGFSIETKNIEEFIEKSEKYSQELLTEEVLSRKLKIDLEIDFNKINWELIKELKKFEPTGVGNPRPTFAVKNVSVLDARAVGFEGRHLKLKLEQKGKVFDAIAFSMGDYLLKLSPDKQTHVAFNLEENIWNGRKSIQLKVKDLKVESG